MGLERYVVDAVLLEWRSPTEVAKAHGISRYWLYKLLARFREGGYEALSPRSRRPRSCSRQIGPDLRVAIVQLRRELEEAGHDAGAAKSFTSAVCVGTRTADVQVAVACGPGTGLSWVGGGRVCTAVSTTSVTFTAGTADAASE